MTANETSNILKGIVEARDFALGARRLVDVLARRAEGAAFVFQWDSEIEGAYPIAAEALDDQVRSEVRELVQAAFGSAEGLIRSGIDCIQVIGDASAPLGAVGTYRAAKEIGVAEWEEDRAAAATVLYGCFSELKLKNFEREHGQMAKERKRLGEVLRSVESRHLRAEKVAAEERARQLEASNRRLEFALRKAEESNRLKGAFLAKISHEVRTPLNALMVVPTALLDEFQTVEGFHCAACDTDFVSDGDTDLGSTSACPTCHETMRASPVVVNAGRSRDQLALLRDMADQGQILSQLITSVLDLHQFEQNRVRLDYEEVSVSEWIHRLINALQPLARNANSTLAVSCPADLRATIDPSRMTQVITNLVGNAIKFSPNGSIRVDVFDEGEQVHLMVEDSGPGIPEPMKEVIFDSFRQIDDSTTRAQGGVGLGLAISREIVGAHDGQIWVESTVGVGSTFHARVPKTPAASKRLRSCAGIRSAG